MLFLNTSVAGEARDVGLRRDQSLRDNAAFLFRCVRAPGPAECVAPGSRRRRGCRRAVAGERLTRTRDACARQSPGPSHVRNGPVCDAERPRRAPAGVSGACPRWFWHVLAAGVCMHDVL